MEVGTGGISRVREESLGRLGEQLKPRIGSGETHGTVELGMGGQTRCHAGHSSPLTELT